MAKKRAKKTNEADNGPVVKEVEIDRVPLPARESLKAAHKFIYSRVGPFLQLDVGFLDAREVVDFRRDERKKPKLYVTDSYALNIEGAIEFIKTAQHIADDLERQGFITREDPLTDDEGGE